MNPVIDSIVASPSVVAPGGAFTVTIVAHDPDESVLTMVGEVKDSQGNSSMGNLVLRRSDPITYILHDVNGAGIQITQRPGQPNVFDCVAP